MSYDANKHLVKYHDKCVFVDNDSLGDFRQRRQANRDRLKNGLEAAGHPQPVEHVPQGSYAMRTMIQAASETSDIDDGVVFEREALKGPRDGDKSANETKEMVRAAVASTEEFKTPPEVRDNCVRIFYADGFHVDMPVYRTYQENGQTRKELASTGEWKRSAPEDITNWFNNEVIEKSPDEKNGRQMRRIVRLLKAWSKSRPSWRMPSGFVISVLVNEAYHTNNGWADRDDLALLSVMRSIKTRLEYNEKVYRPVAPNEEITKAATYGRVRKMRDELQGAIDELSKIERSDCDELMALKALKRIFCTDIFDDRIKELEDGGNDDGSGGSKDRKTPTSAVRKEGGNRQYA